LAGEEPLTESLQEAILAVLAFDAKHGALIATQVAPEHFSGQYHEIAGPVLEYRKKYGKPPGHAHLEHIFSRSKLDPADRRTAALRRTLVNLSSQAEALNAEYIVSRVQDFVRSQKLISALLAANDRAVQGGEGMATDVEGILHTALRYRQTTLDAGTFLNQIEKSALFSPRAEETYALGIPELDRLGIGPAAKRLMLYIAPKNTGKSWACVHVGRQCLLQKAKVVHISLEMSEREVLGRYYQNFFSIATRSDPYTKATLEFDELERLTGFKVRRSKPKLDFGDPGIRKFLRNKVSSWGTRFKRLVIKEYPSGTLTIDALRGYLDYLELVEKFIPNVLIVDYGDLFAIKSTDYRLALGRIFVDLRGLASERNLAVVVPTQSGRSSIGAKRVNSANVTEDISKVFTSDLVIAYSQTNAEEKLGLARLSVEHARNAPRGSVILISQSYSTGQFVLESAALTSNAYWEKLREVTGDDGEG
jgi:hypothetical protein